MNEGKMMLRLGDETLTAEDLMERMVQYGMLPQLLRELLIDRAIAKVEYTDEERDKAIQDMYQHLGLTTQNQLKEWLSRHGMTQVQSEKLAIRSLQLEKFKQQTWTNQVHGYFLKRKGQLDRVVYSMICTKDFSIAQELFFRIQESEQSFAELAREYSQGPEAQTGGLVGPVEVQSLNPTIANFLAKSQPQQVSTPMVVGNWILLLRLEKMLPAQLDETMEQRLINECFNTWLDAQLQQALGTAG
ncbi:MAG: peptidylprolyl isomerase [Oscillatoriales cyanobacterium SM2_2_1]|nr:peptidylprolyl isomerase [Oscillatoriales cyanobacterium SM2_2_1]